ncbi:MAG: 3-hydroxyacyl-CoA dehydrogenase NAD-binding domain-containing protein [Acidiferrobacterales bacterium]
MKHWRMEMRAEHLIATLDVADTSTNVLSREVLQELDQLITEAEQQPVKGLVVRSAKANGFIAGADVREFTKINDAARAAELARAGQQVFSRLQALPFPSAAVIHGYCLGGGLELALACTYRIARDDDSTRFGLPEVRLGIHPGFGGTVRLPAVVGALPALDLMLTGRSIGSKQAHKFGLVDDVVPERYLLDAAFAHLSQKRWRRRLPWSRRLPGWWPLRALVYRRALRQLQKRVNPDHYPAPYRILQLRKQRADQEQEAMSLGELLVSRTSRNLVHVFLLGEELKRQGRKHPHEIERVHVIGAGIMGGDIAAWAAYKGFNVSLQDQSAEIVARALKRAHAFFRKRLKDARAVQQAMDRLMPDVNGNGLTRADIVIEAVVERVGVKQEIFREVEQRAPQSAVLASNTSSIPLEALAVSLRDPSRLVGLHFFNPVAKMQLVEVVHGMNSAQSAVHRASAFTAAIDRLPLLVKSSPGFLVNRILMPYLMEAMSMVEEGVPIASIDRAATDFGMPMGPIELADTVGLDICLSVAQELARPLGVSVPDKLRDMVERGELGKKSGRGFYTYGSGGRPKQGARYAKVSDVPITERLILRILNEAMACLREGVVQDANAIDAGMVYGTGFAPYLGGPMRYVESMGETAISHSLYRLSEEYGERFAPDTGWSQRDLLARPAAAGD